MVELIIVIAIMAILVGIVGANVVPYLEKSRKAKDQQILGQWCVNAMSAYSSNAALIEPDKTYIITVGSSSVSVSGGSDTTCEAIKTSFVELDPSDLGNGYNFANFESKAGKDIKEVVIACCDPKLQPEGGYQNIITVSVEMNTGSPYSFDTIVSN